MRFPIAACSLLFVCASCSNDSSGGGSGGADGSASGGSAGNTGGSSGATGGTAGGGVGGLGAGGSDPALCSTDSGSDSCLLCLARYCCDAIEACYADTNCKTEFDKQQACIKSSTDTSACYSAFVLAGKVDGGPPTLPVAMCIFDPCAMCGKPSPL